MQALVLGLIWGVAGALLHTLGFDAAAKPLGFVVALVVAPALFGKSAPTAKP